MLGALLLVGAAVAGGGRGLPDFGEGRVPPSVTITVSPLRLIDRPLLERPTGSPVLAGGVELRVGETRSIGLLAARPIALGGGGAPGKTPREGFEVGVQVREYVAGDFGNGIAVGAKAAFTNPVPMRWQADRTQIGPFLALKVTAALFTIEAKGGPTVTLDREGLTIAPSVDLAAGVSF